MKVLEHLILMVEDDPDQVDFTKRALAKANLVNPLRIVSSGEEAIAYLSRQVPFGDPQEHPLPSLILLDLKLPGIGGLAVLEWLKKQPELNKISVAVLTSSISPRDRRKADELGVSAYLLKPIDADGLIEMMKSIGMYWLILRPNRDATVHNPPLGVTPGGVQGELPAAVPLGAPLEAPERQESSRKDTEILGDQVRFQKTSWNLVKSSGESQAMDELIRIYWKPLYFFVRQKGYDNETAKDIVQGFLTDALERKTIAKADPERGKFRTFLLAALSNFIRDWHKASSRLKRGGGRATYSLDEEAADGQYTLEPSTGETPETLVHQAWAERTIHHYVSGLTGNPSHLQAFRMLLQGSSYSDISQETGLTESAAKAAVSRLRQQLREELLHKLSGANHRSGRDAEDVDPLASFLQ